jgi:hypothetical protein
MTGSATKQSRGGSRPQAGLLGSSPRFRGSSIRTEKVFNFTALK